MLGSSNYSSFRNAASVRVGDVTEAFTIMLPTLVFLRYHDVTHRAIYNNIFDVIDTLYTNVIDTLYTKKHHLMSHHF